MTRRLHRAIHVALVAFALCLSPSATAQPTMTGWWGDSSGLTTPQQGVLGSNVRTDTDVAGADLTARVTLASPSPWWWLALVGLVLLSRRPATARIDRDRG